MFGVSGVFDVAFVSILYKIWRWSSTIITFYMWRVILSYMFVSSNIVLILYLE